VNGTLLLGVIFRRSRIFAVNDVRTDGLIRARPVPGVCTSTNWSGRAIGETGMSLGVPLFGRGSGIRWSHTSLARLFIQSMRNAVSPRQRKFKIRP